MREVSAKDADRNFTAMLTAVENGETILITRSGQPIATISPAPRDNLGELRQILDEWNAADVLDDGFEANVAGARGRTRADARTVVTPAARVPG